MTTTTGIPFMRHATLAGLIALSMTLAPTLAHVGGAQTPDKHPAPSVIRAISHETTEEMTRVILHADSPIDYRGGMLRGSQVVIDLANVEVALAAPVVELGAPEVDRVVIGPEVPRDGEKVLKVRLTGVKAGSHKVVPKGNELHVELTALKGARDGRKGLPKIINNGSEVMARNAASGSDSDIVWARAVPADSGADRPESAALDPRDVAESAPAGSAPAPPAVEPAPAPAPQATGKIAASASAAPAVQPAPAPAPAAAGMIAAAAPAAAMAAATAAPAAETASSRSLTVSVGRSLTLETGVPVTRVSVSNPAVAEPVAISPTQLLVNGLAPGVVSLVLWPRQGAAIVYDLAVTIDTEALSGQIRTIFPAENVRVQASKDSLVLSGQVSGPVVAESLVKLAGDYSPRVVNHLAVGETSRRQVMLKVKFAEVAKSAMTELSSVLHHVDPVFPAGSDRGTSGTGQFSPPVGNLLNNPIGPELTWSDAINLSFFEKSIDLGIFITALKGRGLFQELAEPTLIAADGQSANFLAGGEFPVPIAQPGSNFIAVTIEWKKFGIMLDFKPTIGKDNVIVMRVKPEVSSLDFSSGVLLSGFRIPSLIVRRTETEVELRDGQSFAIAGLYDRNLLQSKSKIPILGDIPILGYLFRSKGLQKNQTELLVIVTPHLVEPMSAGTELPSIEMPESFDLEKTRTKK